MTGTRFILGWMTVILLAGCASATGKPTTVADLLRSIPLGHRKPATDRLRAQIHDDIAQQHPDTALKRLQDACTNGCRDEELAALFPEVINALLAAARTAQQQGQIVQAGKLYQTAWEGYPEPGNTSHGIELTPEHIARKIDMCADEIMQQGLRLYREGRLEAAIATWDSIQSFRADHQPALIAIETTRTQMHSLAQINQQQRLMQPQ